MAKSKLCTTCGYVGQSKRETKGSFIMEVFLWLILVPGFIMGGFLWLIFLVPGFIYSVWRLTTRYDACPKCAAANMIPTSSPVAKKLLQEQNQPQPVQSAQRHGVPPPLPDKQDFLRIARNGEDLGELPVSTIEQMIASGQLSTQD